MGDFHKSRNWFWIRIGIYLLDFAVHLASAGQARRVWSFEDGRIPLFPLCGTAVVVLLLPLLVVGGVLLWGTRPIADRQWSRPSHYANPGTMRNPLFPLNFIGYVCIAMGAGGAISSIWNGIHASIHGTLNILAGMSVLLGVRLDMKLCKSRIAAASA